MHFLNINVQIKEKKCTLRLLFFLFLSLFLCIESSQADMAHMFQIQNKVTILHPATNILTKSVIFVPQREREKERKVRYVQVCFFCEY